MRSSLLIPVIAALALFATGCEKKGPAETAGENVDEAMEDVKDAAQDVGEEVKEAGEEVKDAVDGK